MNPPGATAPAGWIGKCMDFHCTALGQGRARLLRAERCQRLVLKHGLLRHNDNTIASTRRVAQNLEQVRRLGYAIDDEEEEIGIRCLGAPIVGPEGRVPAAISIVGSTTQIDDDTVPALAALVTDAAGPISDLLPHSLVPEQDSAVRFSISSVGLPSI